MRQRRPVILGALGLAITIVTWHVLTTVASNIFFPPPLEIAARAVQFWSSPAGMESIRLSLTNLFLGLGIGIFVGVVVGIILGRVQRLRRATMPPLDFVRSIPATVLIPLALGVFGLGSGMQVFLIAYGVAWPLLLSTMDGVRGIHSTLLDTAVAYRIGTWHRLTEFIIPAVVPRIATGIRLAIPIGLMLLVTGEMVGSHAGIGYVITHAQATFKFLDMWSGIVLLATLGFTLTWGFTLIERRVLRRFTTAGAR